MANASADPHSIYQFSAKDVDGKEVTMDKYKFVLFFCCLFNDKFRGKAVIFVNVASECGLTDANYKQLKELLDVYKDKGLEIAAFPCNQFGGQVFDLV
jgi:glutathione peroxidase